MTVNLRSFTRADLPTVEPWFEDPTTRRFLGGADWPVRMLDRGDGGVGARFRGATQTGAYRYLANFQGEAIGYIDCGTFDRWVAYGGEDEGGPIIEEVKELPTGAIAFVVDPRRRRHGLGTAMIEALVNYQELAFVRIFEAGVEPENIASARCLQAAGFRLRGSDPDFEGMLYYESTR